jgi:uncharacterized protein Veg
VSRVREEVRINPENRVDVRENSGRNRENKTKQKLKKQKQPGVGVREE